MMRQRLSLLLLALFCLALLTGCDALDVLLDSGGFEAEGELEIWFIDVGQADSALIVCQGETMLIDGGNVADSDLIYTFLRNRSITHLDYIVCTHAHEDHVGGLAAALNEATASHVLSPVTEYDTRAFSNFVAAAENRGLTIEVPKAGSGFTLGGAEVRVLGPLDEYEETNNSSIVLKIIFGQTSFLFTGDMEREAEQDLIDAGLDLSADVLKVGHHGSSTSSSYVFIRAVRPSYGVISCELDGPYGHPHDEVMSRYRDAEVKLYRTDLQGTVHCVSDGSEISFDTEKSFDIDTNPASEYTGRYIGNANTKKLHRESCASLPSEANRVLFNSLEEAYSQGYEPHSACMK